MARVKALLHLLPGVDTNLLVQPIHPVEHRLLIESVSRGIPLSLLVLRRRFVQRLRIGLGYQAVQPSVLQQQRGRRRVRNESNRLYRRHVPEPAETCCTGQTPHEVEIFRTGEVRDETAVSYYEHGGFDALFDAGE